MDKETASTTVVESIGIGLEKISSSWINGLVSGVKKIVSRGAVTEEAKIVAKKPIAKTVASAADPAAASAVPKAARVKPAPAQAPAQNANPGVAAQPKPQPQAQPQVAAQPKPQPQPQQAPAQQQAPAPAADVVATPKTGFGSERWHTPAAIGGAAVGGYMLGNR